MTPVPEMLTFDELADRLNVPVKHLRKLSRTEGSGFPPVYRISPRTIRVRADDAEKWLEQVRETPELLKLRVQLRARHAEGWKGDRRA